MASFAARSVRALAEGQFHPILQEPGLAAAATEALDVDVIAHIRARARM